MCIFLSTKYIPAAAKPSTHADDEQTNTLLWRARKNENYAIKVSAKDQTNEKRWIERNEDFKNKFEKFTNQSMTIQLDVENELSENCDSTMSCLCCCEKIRFCRNNCWSGHLPTSKFSGFLMGSARIALVYNWLFWIMSTCEISSANGRPDRIESKRCCEMTTQPSANWKLNRIK